MVFGRRFVPRSRLMTALFLLFNAGMFAWFLVDRRRVVVDCRPGRCGAAVALAFVLTLWVFGALALSVIWLVVERRLGWRELADSVRPREESEQS
jgi:hypothetical protein